LVVNLGVEDGRNLVFDFAIDFDWRWWRLGMIQNSVRSCGFQLEDMEDWVDSMEMVQKLQGD
jgi:hypothetical protein